MGISDIAVTRGYGRLPLSNIVPFTYRDGITFADLLYSLRDYVKDDLHTGFTADLNGIITAVNKELSTMGVQLDENNAELIDEVNRRVDIISNRVGPENMKRINLTSNYTLNAEPAWPTAHPILFQVKQPSVGGKALTLGTGITGPLELDRAGNAITEFYLIPDGVGNWNVSQNGLDVEAQRSRALARFNGIMSAMSQRSVVFCTAGSSTTAGAFAEPYENGYVPLLSRAINQSFPAPFKETVTDADTAFLSMGHLNKGLHTVNIGLGGTNSGNYFSTRNLDWVSRIAADAGLVILHMIGANDWSTLTPLATYKQNILGVINKMNEGRNEPPLHILVHAYERSDGHRVPGHLPWDDYGEVLRELAQEDSDNRLFIDLSGDYRNIGIPGADPLKFMTSDLVHQNTEGHAYMAKLLADKLKLAPSYSGDLTIKTIQDTFIGTDNTTLQGRVPADGVAAWEFGPASTDYAIVGNALKPLGVAGLAGFDAGMNDLVVSSRMTIPTAGTCGIWLRGDIATGQRLMGYYTGTSFRIARVSSSGTLSELCAVALPNPAGSMVTLELHAKGKEVQAFQDGKLLAAITLTESAYCFQNGLTYAGIRTANASSTSAIIHDFKVMGK